jgi:CelD/BcsL family acetyltransferase involved in cellulose biosynthesis
MQAVVNDQTLALELSDAQLVAGQPTTAALPGTRLSDPTRLQLAVITRLAQFEALESEWNALFDRVARSSQVFQSFNWLWHWVNHYLNDRMCLSVVTGRLDGRLVMVWPLIVRNLVAVRQLSWMGEPTIEYGDILIDQSSESRHLVHQAWGMLKSLDIDLIYLRKVRSDAMIAPFLAEFGTKCIEFSSVPYLSLAGTRNFELYELRYTAKTRANHRRHLRRLNETGSIAFVENREGPVARELANHALEMKRGWLVREGRFSRVLQDPRFAGFLRDIANGETRPVGARLCAVCCDGAPIAIEISIAHRDRVFGHLIVQDPRFKKQGLGRILAQYSIATAHQQGFAIYDLLAPDDDYKMDWADGSVGLRDYACPVSSLGRVHAGIWLGYVRPSAKSFVNGNSGKYVLRKMAGLRRLLHAE